MLKSAKLMSVLIIATLTSLVFSQETIKPLTIEDIFHSQKFRGATLRGIHWMQNGKSFLYNERDRESGTTNFMSYDIKSGTRRLFLSGKDLSAQNGKAPFRFQNNIWSADENFILFTETQRARRVKTGGNFHLYDVQAKSLKTLTDTDKHQVNVKFSPNGRSIAFVRENNLMLMDLANGSEKQLTFDGKEHVLNGHFDWVYEEEFSFDKAFFWSVDGSKIAYYRFDESHVKEFSMAMYGSLYPEEYKFKYPKAGEENSIVSIHVYDLETEKTIKVAETDNMKPDGKDEYIPRITWTKDPGYLSVQVMNRHQNRLKLLLVNADN
ncbi:MAG: DPP IV N-terminal domain-containing protein, partial [bacterium]